MATLEELLHPLTPTQFHAEYEGRKPLYVPAAEGAPKGGLLTWQAFNDLLGQSGHWTGQNLRLMRDHVAVPMAEFCQPTPTPDGEVMRVSPRRVELFLSAGASLVANDVLQMHPPLAETGADLARRFGARVGANIYCSFEGVRAFGTHFDNHDVVVVQTGGTKTWNLYEARAENPVDLVPDTQESRQWFQQTRGAVMQEIVMRPGDMLYLPRGWYHDALAAGGPSLHVTFSITPLWGRDLLSLLDSASMEDAVFRDWLPPADREGGELLRARLREVGLRLAALAESPTVFEQVAMAQERLAPRPARFDLPRRRPVTLYRTTGRAFPPATTRVRMAYDWALRERRFALEEMIVEFDFLTEAEVRAAIEAAAAAGAVQRA